MDLQIRHVVAAKVIRMRWYRGQVAQNLTFKSYPRVRLKCSFTNAEKSNPERVWMPCSLSIKLGRKIRLQRSHADILLPFTSFRVRAPFGCELSNSRMPMNVTYNGLKGGAYSFYFGSTTRLFSQIPRMGTQHKVVRTEGEVGGKQYSPKTSNKHEELPRACAAHKNKTSMHESASRSSEGMVAGSGDVRLPSLNGSKTNENSFDVESTQAPKGKDKVKQRSRSKRRQNQSSSAPAAKAADTHNSSATKFQAKDTKISESTQSPTLLEISSTSSTQKETTHSSISTKTIAAKAARKSAKKGKNNTHPSPTSDKELTEQFGGKISASKDSPHINKTKCRSQRTWPQLYPPISKSVVVVESVAKAKIIQGYLGEMFEVLPSYGHVRDLAARSGSVRPDDDFSMVWEVPSSAWSHLKSIKVALSGAENLILASDPDREGEAIAWHIIEMLKQQDALREDVTVARVTFNEITESSVKNALQSPREINADMVHAYLARRALDYLIGFNVSPLLWRNLPGCQSAGRVQSAALALICDREREIDDFKAQEYWTVNAQFETKDLTSANNVSLPSHLTSFDSKRLQQLSISSNAEAKGIEEKINMSKFEVIGTKTSKIQKKPPVPYITSSLQQDAANKLNFSASHTMKVAQKLYEGVQLYDDKATGLITYMRTDGLHLSDEAAKDILSFVGERYGLKFAAKSPRKYFKKVKNAQEAHEAIRPTDIRRLPSMLAGLLDEDSLKLYTLIWARTMACQMEPAIIEQIQCDIGNASQSIIFRSTSSMVGFSGFQAVYEDAQTIQVRDDKDEESDHKEVFEILSNLQRGQPLSLAGVGSEQHHTQPPPRYSEGSLVKKLEELGIGRPSTYATTIKVLKDRNYVIMKNRMYHPEFRGRMVSAFLSHYFSEVTDYSFTADMESELDNVSAGMTEWKGLLKDYWTRFSKYCQSAGKVHMHQVEKILEKSFGNALFSSLPDGDRTCPSCLVGTLGFKVSRFGAGYFIACDHFPQCKYIAKTLYGEDDEDDNFEDKKKSVEEPKLLGLYPTTNEKVLLKCGPFGHYVQLGEDRKGYQPKRASLAHIKDVESVTLEDALDLLQYPLTLGKHPDDNQPVIIRLGRIGFAIKHRRTMAPVPKNVKPKDVTLEKALQLLKGKDVRRCGRPKREHVVEEAIEAM